MKVTFENRLEAIEWIANYAEDEKHFEELREKLNYNYIYTHQFFIEIDDSDASKEGLDKMMELS